MKRWTASKYGRDLEDVFTHFNPNLSLNSWQVKRGRMPYTFSKLVACIILGGTVLLVSKGKSFSLVEKLPKLTSQRYQMIAKSSKGFQAFLYISLLL